MPQQEQAPPPQKTQSFYLPELDILRFFAFFVVFLHHCLPQTAEAYQDKLGFLSVWMASAVTAGGLGVDLFFALSSYLITELLIREYEKKGSIDALSFYIRRALRIFPLYYAFVLLSIFVFPYFLPNNSLDYPHNLGFLVFAGNWTCAFWGYPGSVASPLWSVSIEEQFYIVFPFLVVLFGVKRLKLIAIGLLIIAFITRGLLVGMDVPHPGIWANTFARLDPIAGGVLFALLLKGGYLKAINRQMIRFLVCLAGISLGVLATRYFNFSGSGALILYPMAAIGSLLIIWSTISPRSADVKRYSPLLIYLGRISYGLYVFHILGIELANLAAEQLNLKALTYLGWKFAVGLSITIILSVISYNLLEKPFLKLKKKFTFVASRPI
jgi:peptidoglycan/LPS O-acetylase OafA/YrhL